MSRDNVEIVRRAWEAWERSGIAGLLAFLDPEIECRAIEGAPDDVGEMRGRDANRAYIQDWLDTFEDLSNTAVEIHDAGDDRVVSVQHVEGRARMSGVETTLDYAIVYTVRDGLIVRGKEYATRAEALEAAELGE
jgi:ketosteroid isomerase-like protein